MNKCRNPKYITWCGYENLTPLFKTYTKIGHLTEISVLPCGKCDFCLKLRAQEYTFRFYWHTKQHGRPLFLTLCHDFFTTSFDKQKIKNFIRRLRYHHSGVSYYVSGEKGKLTGHAHYHLLIWGLPSSFFNDLYIMERKGDYTENGSVAKSDNYKSPLISKIWGERHRCSTANTNAMYYVGSYLNKNSVDTFNFSSHNLGVYFLQYYDYNVDRINYFYDNGYFIEGYRYTPGRYYTKKMRVLYPDFRVFDTYKLYNQLVDFRKLVGSFDIVNYRDFINGLDIGQISKLC